MVAHPDAVTKVRKLAPVTGSPRPGLKAVRRQYSKSSPSGALSIRERCYIGIALRCLVLNSYARNRKTYAAVNLDRLQHWIDQGRLHSTPEKPITAKELLLSGCVHNVYDGIKLLGNVRVLVTQTPFIPCSCFNLQGAEFLKAAVHITPSRVSKSAIKAIEAKGGSVFCQYYNSLALRDCIKGRTDRVSAAPTRRNDISAYLALCGNLAFHI